MHAAGHGAAEGGCEARNGGAGTRCAQTQKCAHLSSSAAGCARKPLEFQQSPSRCLRQDAALLLTFAPLLQPFATQMTTFARDVIICRARRRGRQRGAPRGARAGQISFTMTKTVLGYYS
jgi:hypothetical protein